MTFHQKVDIYNTHTHTHTQARIYTIGVYSISLSLYIYIYARILYMYIYIYTISRIYLQSRKRSNVTVAIILCENLFLFVVYPPENLIWRVFVCVRVQSRVYIDVYRCFSLSLYFSVHSRRLHHTNNDVKPSA
jgi:hypothetical protein